MVTRQEKFIYANASTRCGALPLELHTNNQNKLFWHWSPNNGFDMKLPVWGYNECLITYIMSASSPNHKHCQKCV